MGNLVNYYYNAVFLFKFHKGFEKAAKIIKDADMLLFCTGAGMGVDSGLPDFRLVIFILFRKLE